MYIEGILERLNLTDTISEDGFMFLDGTIGEWLEHHEPLFNHYFRTLATGKYLDLIGKEQGLLRYENESDEDFRKRLLIDNTIVESASDFSKVGVDLWVYDENVLNEENYLTSKNPCLKGVDSPVFLAHADDLAKDYIMNKFFVEGDIVWF